MASSFPIDNMKPTSFLTWWHSIQVTSDVKDISASMRGDENFTKLGSHESNIESPLLGPQDYPVKQKSWGKLIISLLAFLTIACLALTTNWSSSKLLQLINTSDDIVHSKKGVVVSDDARCSDVGVSMLQKGGNAVDAAIATALCLGVVSPTESGIGGGSFMVVYNASTQKAVAFNMRETAPGAAHKDMYEKDPDAQVKGPLSIAVLGELKGLRLAWEKYGKLEWQTLFQPAINYSKNGFQVFPYLASDLQEFQKDILADTGLKQVFAPYGDVLKKGETCYNTKLAETLEAVATQGPQVLYNGVVGQKLVQDVRDLGGILTMEDLRNYKVNVTNVLAVETLGYKLLGMPPPSSGTVGVAMVANILSNYGCPDELKGPLGLHRLTEAMKHMSAIRVNLSDPAFVDVSKYIYEMTSPAYAQEIWRKINDSRTFPPEYYERRWRPVQDLGTSHLGVVDSERNAVALTTSVNDQFGSKILSPSTGIVINNQMRDFSTPTQEQPAPANYIEPGKRPLSSMTPLVLLKDWQLAGVIGGSGGLNIVPALTQVFLNNFVLGMDPLKSVQNPRIYPKVNVTDVEYENVTVVSGKHIELPLETRKYLASKGHNLTEVGFPATIHLIKQTFENSIMDLGRKYGRETIEDVKFGILTAVGDLRKDGKPTAL